MFILVVTRGGGPAKQRRIERRAAARQASAAAEKAAADASIGQEQVPAEEAVAKEAAIAEADNVFGKVTNSPIPQIDGTADSTICYELEVEAHKKCSNDDIIEAIETNFLGSLDEQNVEKCDPLRYLVVKKSIGKQVGQNIQVYEVNIKENEISTNIIEGWNEWYTFDNLAFKNSVYDEIDIRIRGVQRLD